MIRLQNGVPLVEVERSGVVESVHTGHVVVLAADGAVLHQLGTPAQPIFPRSSNKPLQAVGMCRAGLALDDVGTALSAASHSGEPFHVEAVSALLTEAGLSENDLQCPADLPLGVAASQGWLASGGGPERIRMNCSGKHTAMLRTSLLNGWSVAEYLRPDLPLQQTLADTVAELAGEPIAATGVDGCGAPVFALSLLGVARGFARIATSSETACAAVADAMRTMPEYVAGTGRAATRLMNGIPGLIAKDGAEGIYAAALPDGTVVALKIDDGAARAADIAVAGALRLAGVEAAVLDELISVPLLGGGVQVGAMRWATSA